MGRKRGSYQQNIHRPRGCTGVGTRILGFGGEGGKGSEQPFSETRNGLLEGPRAPLRNFKQLHCFLSKTFASLQSRGNLSRIENDFSTRSRSLTSSSLKLCPDLLVLAVSLSKGRHMYNNHEESHLDGHVDETSRCGLSCS